jgi:putative transposase
MIGDVIPVVDCVTYLFDGPHAPCKGRLLDGNLFLQTHRFPTVYDTDLPPWNVPISKVRIWDTSKGDSMSRKRYTAEQIIGHLRQAEIRTSEGKTIAEAVRELGISEQTYYWWRKQYGGMEVNQARRLKELQQENGRLKRLVADQALDNLILKEVCLGNF